jgi:hypothetical protein
MIHMGRDPRAARLSARLADIMMASFGYVRSEPAPNPGFRYTLAELPANRIAQAAWNRLKRCKATNRVRK